MRSITMGLNSSSAGGLPEQAVAATRIKTRERIAVNFFIFIAIAYLCVRVFWKMIDFG